MTESKHISSENLSKITSDLISSPEHKSSKISDSKIQEVSSTIDTNVQAAPKLNQKESREEEDMEVTQDLSGSGNRSSAPYGPVEQFVIATMDHNLQSESTEDSQPAKKRKTESESSENLLDFAKGEVIKVIQKDETGWWWGQKYQVKSKTLYGKCGWFPSTYVKEYYTTILPTKIDDPVLQSLNTLQQYPADWYSYCYTTGLKPQEAAAAMAGADPNYRFKGQPLLVTSNLGKRERRP